MEEELKCPVCHQLFANPVLLPCFHALCSSCALEIQVPSGTSVNHSINQISQSHPHQIQLNSSASSSTTDSISSDQEDKVSIFSEADSGVICTISRPASYAGTPNLQGLLFTSAQGASVYSLCCPCCRKVVFLDENGARNLPIYRAMENIVDRFCEREALKCQMCETEPPKVASIVCEQCEIRYCDTCRELCHPSRGPLKEHSLKKPRGASQIRETICGDHNDLLSMYCITCKIPACAQCISENRHNLHEIQPISIMSKAQKTELSQILQQLSEKARSTTEFIHRLKGMSDKVTESSLEFEHLVVQQCENLIRAINERRRCLVESIRLDKESKIRSLKEQQLNCTGKLQKTTGLIQFCIETLKETDNAAFLQVGSMLIHRVANTDLTWHQKVTNAAPRVSPTVELTFDDSNVLRAIDNLSFVQMKSTEEDEDRMISTVPLPPQIISEECSAENNSVTVAWKPPHFFVQGYVLELDDGNGGDFSEVYCGKETICTVDGLHFNSLYNARVKAFNSVGEGEYSEMIGLQTSEVAWFTFDPVLSLVPSSSMLFANGNKTITVDGWEHNVALGSVGFSRGIHYWEFTVDKYTSDTDPAVGIARLDVARDKMLGQDDKGFAMYVDRKRSWFQHNGVHERRVEGGISTGSTIGVLLDLERHTLRFLINEMPQGSIAFKDLYGVFYPALSVNRGTTMTLQSGLFAPRMDY